MCVVEAAGRRRLTWRASWLRRAACVSSWAPRWRGSWLPPCSTMQPRQDGVGDRRALLTKDDAAQRQQAGLSNAAQQEAAVRLAVCRTWWRAAAWPWGSQSPPPSPPSWWTWGSSAGTAQAAGSRAAREGPRRAATEAQRAAAAGGGGAVAAGGGGGPLSLSQFETESGGTGNEGGWAASARCGCQRSCFSAGTHHCPGRLHRRWRRLLGRVGPRRWFMSPAAGGELR